jgi:hypothetical protein
VVEVVECGGGGGVRRRSLRWWSLKWSVVEGGSGVDVTHH